METGETKLAYIPKRSYLFVPGHRPELIAKAKGKGAHAVVVDLEDAVGPDAKADARESLRGWLKSGREIYVRINSSGTSHFEADLTLVGSPGVCGVILPKCERSEEVERVRSAGASCVIPLVETARGFRNLEALCQTESVQRILFGTIDFQVDLGIVGDGDELLYFRSHIVLVSKLYGLQAPIDGVCTAIGDENRLRDETERGKRLGFGAKACIHPSQVEVVNRAFRPTADQITWAHRVLAAFSESGGGAVSVDGQMIDVPVVLQAREILSSAGEPVS
ncbi:HpcH/HpaI aldolase/citrate lyase family protein [Paraburkholderia tuberum]|uniref:Citrate lyase subunit beta / citryl-CoA lyase n=1 Tax=Paraburkholderia tuberum TaxID=157910 RepID=A0A1H1KHB2_9BURK|nr:CoA ester lyase [Paraburkholderia tuberum]SDR61674.1 citrate lyase subunit beta / citryl-CoA lyase [Paraburkholderia tuberum]